MKSTKALWLLWGLLLLSWIAKAQIGLPDSSFHFDGTTFFYFEGGKAAASALKVLPNGKIQVVGTVTTGPGADSDFLLLRYGVNGLPDASFGEGGFALFDWGNQHDVAKAVALLPDGRIVVAGCTYSDGKVHGLLCCFLPDGKLDLSFGSDGVIYDDLELRDSPSMDVFVTGEGKILWCFSTKKHYSVISRYWPNGAVDMDYGNSGRVMYQGLFQTEQAIWALLPGDTMTVFFSVILQNDFSGPQFDCTLIKYSADGKMLLFSNSNVDGKYLNDALAWNGGIAIAGDVVSKSDSKGRLDGNFAFNGKQTAVTGIANALAFQIDGKLVSSGHDGRETDKRMVVTRMDTDGELDKKFGQYGKLLLDFSGGDDIANAIALDADDRILVAGQSGDSLVVVRLWGSKYTGPTSPGVADFSFGFWPNPVGRVILADYALPVDGSISLELLDLHGRQVQVFYKLANRQAGRYVEPLVPLAALANGEYLLRFRSGAYSMLKKMVLVR